MSFRCVSVDAKHVNGRMNLEFRREPCAGYRSANNLPGRDILKATGLESSGGWEGKIRTSRTDS